MRLSTALFVALSAIVASASPETATASSPAIVDVAIAEARATSAIDKRALCIGFLCIGSTTTNYQTDVNNCGAANKKCQTTWSNGSGSQCVAGSCFPGSCNVGYALNSLSGQCQNVATDTANCGAIGNVCAVTGAATNQCVAGTCYASTCGTGYTYAAGVCTVKIDTTSDVNNCGLTGYKCPTPAGAAGVKCSASQCVPTSCSAGYTAFGNYCFNLGNDVNNCGASGKVCTFPNGSGSCSSGVCTVTSCNSGFYNVNGVCTSLNLQTDPSNCGTVGKVCSYTNGVATCSAGTCALASCASGYTMSTSYNLFGILGSSTSCTAVNYATDVNNCGTLGNKCTFANGAGSCSSGVCTYSSCNTGFYNIGNTCTALNLQTDPANCGTVGTVCSYSNGVASCTAGKCTLASCNSGYTQTSSTTYNLFGILGSSTTSGCQAVNTLTDMNNCGTVGNKCAATYANGGAGSCVAGACFSTCNGGYAWDSSLSYCRAVTSDLQNCGSVGNVCPTTLGTASCTSGKCAYATCISGYKLVSGTCTGVDLTSDINNCGTIGNVCPATYTGGGAGSCVAGKCTTTCSTGYSWDSTLNYCRDVRTDLLNCGAIGSVCSTSKVAGAFTVACSAGSCLATSCTTSYTLSNGACTAVNTLSDVNNCGFAGNVCKFNSPSKSGICSNGVCTVKDCVTGYTLTSGICVLSPSQAAHAKKSKIVAPRTLCPGKETACPIAGSSTYGAAIAQHFSNADEYSGINIGEGGFECVDTTQQLDSCGGCASTGEGQDCTAIRGAQGVTCEASKCVILSCAPSWKISLDGSKCVRARSHNASRSHNATTHKRHLAHRAAHASTL